MDTTVFKEVDTDVCVVVNNFLEVESIVFMEVDNGLNVKVGTSVGINVD